MDVNCSRFITKAVLYVPSAAQICLQLQLHAAWKCFEDITLGQRTLLSLLSPSTMNSGASIVNLIKPPRAVNTASEWVTHSVEWKGCLANCPGERTSFPPAGGCPLLLFLTLWPHWGDPQWQLLGPPWHLCSCLVLLGCPCLLILFFFVFSYRGIQFRSPLRSPRSLLLWFPLRMPAN